MWFWPGFQTTKNAEVESAEVFNAKGFLTIVMMIHQCTFFEAYVIGDVKGWPQSSPAPSSDVNLWHHWWRRLQKKYKRSNNSDKFLACIASIAKLNWGIFCLPSPNLMSSLILFLRLMSNLEISWIDSVRKLNEVFAGSWMFK